MIEEERLAHQRGLNIRDAIVFLVDFRTPMLRKDAAISIDEDLCPIPAASSLLSITLRCIADVMKSKIVARSFDAISVVLFGVRGSVGRQDWPRVKVIRKLSQCDAAGVKMLQRIAQRLEAGEADALIDIENSEVDNLPVAETDKEFCFGSDTEVDFDKALWAVRHQFTAMSAAKKTVLHRKRLFVFTNDPDPSRGRENIKSLCITQAKDLADMGASIDISLLTSPAQIAETGLTEDTEEPSKFFSDIIYTDHDVQNETLGSLTLSTIYSFEELRTTVRRKEMIKRARRKTFLQLGGDYKIGVALYALVMKAKRPTKVELVASTNKPLFKVTTNRCEEIGRILKPAEIRYTFTPDFMKTTATKARNVLDDKALEGQPPKEEPSNIGAFAKSELVKAKALGQGGVILYGFRNRNVVRKELTVSPALFVYPDDTELIGSTKSFVALHSTMMKREVVAIVSVRLFANTTTGIRFAVLVPQEGEYTPNAEQLVPAGFQMYYLPYQNDIYTAWRKEMLSFSAKQNEELRVKEEAKMEGDSIVKKEPECLPDRMIDRELAIEPKEVSWARKLVKKLKIRDYSPSLFLNPDLQRFYAGLENAAGVESSFNPQDDLLNPDVVQMQTRASYVIDELKNLTCGKDFSGEDESEKHGTKTGKRAAEQSEKSLRKVGERKRLKTEALEQCNVENFFNLYRNKRLASLRKPELQLYCRAHELHDKGTKSNLLIAVEDHIAKQLGSRGM